ncbi:hypothetical protein DEO23_10160 [Brachybacterium endophyticum]|uniref:Uncharacterized protein n=1 Tax=Brachybacterium endophyticum TaxID=2182385 RepID=A0A2U2RJY6_9MICO|nr:hypothetical protein [Brachybacterium endophyticum]PWH06156.1 hypothetical protein DEO23_10160 [Brachybacterium endophyticum]
MTVALPEPRRNGAAHRGAAGAEAGTAALPQSTGPGGAIPSLAQLREALRGPESPLPAPRTADEAAARVRDRTASGDLSGALRVARVFAALPGTDEARRELLRARLAAHRAANDDGSARALARELVTSIDRAGSPLQARASAEVFAEHLRPAPDGSDEERQAPSASGARGRRRAEQTAIPEGLLAIVRCVELPRPSHLSRISDPSGISHPSRAAESRQELTRLQEALQALPAHTQDLVDTPGPLLGVRLGQCLEAAGREDDALRLCRDVLDEVAHLQAREGGFVDAARVVMTAHAVLARVLASRDPIAAVGHSLTALDGMHEVEDLSLRVRLITDLLRALVMSDLQDQASFAAGRLASFARTLPSAEQKVEPLLAVGAQRVAARRYDAAEVVLGEARRASTEAGDRRGRLEATRLLARSHHEQGHGREALAHLRRTAADARWVADDLLTPTLERPLYVRTELDAEALALRHALDLATPVEAAAAARAIVRRVRIEDRAGTMPAPLLWDHGVDARIGALIAEGIRLAEATTGPTFTGPTPTGPTPAGQAPTAPTRTGPTPTGPTDAWAASAAASAPVDPSGVERYEQLFREAGRALEQVPHGHEDRARYWGAYLEDRHAHMLAARGEFAAATSAGRQALRAWQQLGRDEEAAGLDEQIRIWRTTDDRRGTA